MYLGKLEVYGGCRKLQKVTQKWSGMRAGRQPLFASTNQGGLDEEGETNTKSGEGIRRGWESESESHRGGKEGKGVPTATQLAVSIYGED